MTDELRRIIAEFRADSGTIHLIGADGQLHLAASFNIPAAVADIVATVPIGKGMAGLAAERAEPVSVCNIQTDDSGDVRPGARATGLEGAIAVPMMRGEEVAGVLGIANFAPRTFTVQEIAVLLGEGRRLLEAQQPQEDPPRA
jgi:L-methionine (R)-S-oxide reductase